MLQELDTHSLDLTEPAMLYLFALQDSKQADTAVVTLPSVYQCSVKSSLATEDTKYKMYGPLCDLQWSQFTVLVLLCALAYHIEPTPLQKLDDKKYRLFLAAPFYRARSDNRND
jgi:hypothetical protein